MSGIFGTYTYLHILVDLYFLTNYLLRAFFPMAFQRSSIFQNLNDEKIYEKMAKMQSFFLLSFQHWCAKWYHMVHRVHCFILTFCKLCKNRKCKNIKCENIKGKIIFAENYLIRWENQWNKFQFLHFWFLHYENVRVKQHD